MTILTFLILIFSCGNHQNKVAENQRVGNNQAIFTLSAGEGMARDKACFEAREYILNFSEAVVKEGSYSGIEIVFSLKENENDVLNLGFELPAAKTMKVWYTPQGVKAEIPAVPFTVTEKDFQGLKNALYETEQSTYLYLVREHRYASDGISVQSFYFNQFELEITHADFGGQTFSMDCHFKASADKAYQDQTKMNYSLEGSFSVSGASYGFAEVD